MQFNKKFVTVSYRENKRENIFYFQIPCDAYSSDTQELEQL